MQINIQAISYYLPEYRLTNELLNLEFPEWSVEKIAAKIGINTRRIAAADEFVSDMAVSAATGLFSEHGVSPTTIDYLIICTQSPDYFLPTTACLVHERLGMSNTAGAIDINQGCSGFIYGLSLAKGLIAADDAKNVLLITAETYSKFIHPKDKSNRTIFGDAAAATLVTSDVIKGSQIGRFALGTDGKGAENLIVKKGAARGKNTIEHDFVTDPAGNGMNENYLYMNGSEIFNFTIEAVPALVENVLKKNHLNAEHIDLYIFHQANQFMLNYLRKKINIPYEKFYIFMEDCGNTVSSTIPIALKQALQEGKIKTGDKVLIAGFGVGYSWGGTILQY